MYIFLILSLCSLFERKTDQFYAKHHFVFVYYHETKGSAYHRKVSICIITILIENCIIKRIIMLKNISVDESKY